MSSPRPVAPDLPDWLEPVLEISRTAPPWLPDFTAPAGSSPRAASVLILFGEGANGPEVLLTERSHDMRSHAGQVAFPGGSQDLEDADAVDAALREAQEETGLDPVGVDVFGELPPLWLPPSNFVVTPVLGWWREPTPVRAVDPGETASVHIVSIAELVEPANRVTVHHPSGHRGAGFLVRGLVVWGFTAALLDRLFNLSGWERPWDTSRVIDLPAVLVESSLRDLERWQVEP
jgi:8-oxo-dGTP pyrophosphatase MutT (NUDIX family)